MHLWDEGKIIFVRPTPRCLEDLRLLLQGSIEFSIEFGKTLSCEAPNDNIEPARDEARPVLLNEICQDPVATMVLPNVIKKSSPKHVRGRTSRWKIRVGSDPFNGEVLTFKGRDPQPPEKQRVMKPSCASVV